MAARPRGPGSQRQGLPWADAASTPPPCAGPWSCRSPASSPQTWCSYPRVSTPWRATPHPSEATTSPPSVSRVCGRPAVRWAVRAPGIPSSGCGRRQPQNPKDVLTPYRNHNAGSPESTRPQAAGAPGPEAQQACGLPTAAVSWGRVPLLLRAVVPRGAWGVPALNSVKTERAESRLPPVRRGETCVSSPSLANHAGDNSPHPTPVPATERPGRPHPDQRLGGCSGRDAWGSPGRALVKGACPPPPHGESMVQQRGNPATEDSLAESTCPVRGPRG